MGLKIECTTDRSVDYFFDTFMETIEGRLYGGVIIEKYGNEDIYTYLMYDGSLYKIGKSLNPEKRLKELKTANPRCELLYYSKHIPEKYLHDLFIHKNFAREWFQLDDEEALLLRNLLSVKNKESAQMLMRMAIKRIKKNKPNRAEMKEKYYGNVKLGFGKYKGKSIKSMSDPEELRYLRWLKSEMDGKKDKVNTELYKALQHVLTA